MKDLQKIESGLLLQMYANANTTCACGGHWKGEMNDRFRLSYAEELATRGIIVPKNLDEILDNSFVANVEIPEGRFNGEGSY
tara:strand:- start:189 stop:434 length:246 start_codon:yes stop_codon:yes gene_type:complete